MPSVKRFGPLILLWGLAVFIIAVDIQHQGSIKRDALSSTNNEKISSVRAETLPSIKNAPPMPVPKWHVGEWWEVKAGYLAMYTYGPNWVVKRLRYTVESVDKFEGYKVYVVSVRHLEAASTFSRVYDWYYFRCSDLSVIKHESSSGTNIQSPGHPTRLPDVGWPVFPLESGRERRTEYDDRRFKRADGTVINNVPQWTSFSGLLRMKTAVKLVSMDGAKRRVYQVDFDGLNKNYVRIEHSRRQNGTIVYYDIKKVIYSAEGNGRGHSRWVSGVDWPVQGWSDDNTMQPTWFRLIDSSEGLPFRAPRPRIMGDKFVEPE